ncbi:hypothetical protein HYV72_02150 [Candidatus Uhrbacteria bacterium]|nr:hypothetical protein [Candidatus Uhrbacteria bacterium]
MEYTKVEEIVSNIREPIFGFVILQRSGGVRRAALYLTSEEYNHIMSDGDGDETALWNFELDRGGLANKLSIMFPALAVVMGAESIGTLRSALEEAFLAGMKAGMERRTEHSKRVLLVALPPRRSDDEPA